MIFYTIELYKPDLILAVGYRVRSARGVEFRRWASTVIKEYLEKGFAMNDERLKNLGGGNSWKQLLVRITQARSTRRRSARFAGLTVCRAHYGEFVPPPPPRPPVPTFPVDSPCHRVPAVAR